MTDDYQLAAPESFWAKVKRLVNQSDESPRGVAVEPEPLPEDAPPPIRFITLEPYSTYVVKTYPGTGYTSYDLDGDNRGGQEYAVTVDGDTPVDVAVMHYEYNGNHKQLVSFVGDTINGSVKLALGEHETDQITLNDVTAASLREELEKLPQIGLGNLKVTVYPGRWLIEFTGKLAGQTFDPFEVDRLESSVFEAHVLITKWNDSNATARVLYPIPLAGEWDGDDSVINDAVAAGSFGTAKWFPAAGYVVDVNECRDFNGDGTPNL